MATKYVRKTGNDANTGTNATTDAVLTIGRANALVVSGDTINIGAGTFSETGVVGNVSNVTYQGAGISNTIITGNFPTNVAIQIIKDLRFNLTSYAAATGSTTITYTNVWLDGTSAGTQSGTMIFYPTSGSTFKGCIFRNLMGAGVIGVGTYAVLAVANGTINKFYNCVFYGIGGSIFYNYGISTATLKVRNCIFQHVNWLDSSGASAGYDNADRAFNYYYDFGQVWLTLYGANEYQGDPKMVDAAGGDFRLSSNSPCISAGTGSLP